jgi:hypothetical protein
VTCLAKLGKYAGFNDVKYVPSPKSNHRDGEKHGPQKGYWARTNLKCTKQQSSHFQELSHS